MHSRYEQGGVVWIDLESPTRDEVRAIVDEFNVDGMVAEELLVPSTKPHAELHEGYAYLVLHFPALRHSHASREQEIDFLIGHNFLITTRYDTIDPLHKFSKIFEVNSMLDRSTMVENAGYLFFYMLRRLYRSVDHEVEYVRHELAMIEENIFKGHEVKMVEAISRSSRDLLNLRQTLEPHREVLHSFEDMAPSLFGNVYMQHAHALSNEYYRVHNHVMRHIDFLHELRETNNSLLTTKQNETMRVLTIMALLTFPLSLLVAILDTGTKSNPIRGLPYDFWIVVGMIITAGLVLLWVFRKKDWL